MQRWRFRPGQLTGVEGELPSPVLRFLCSTLLVVLCFHGFLANSSTAQEYTLEQIRQGYLENLNQIVTLDANWHEVSIPSSGTGLPPVHTDVHWKQSGKKWYKSRINHGTPSPGDITMTDGVNSWRAEMVIGQELPVAVLQQKFQEIRDLQWSISEGFGRFLGLALIPGSKRSLGTTSVADFLLSPEVQLHGETEFNSSQCVKVSCESWIRAGDSSPVTIEVLFDLNRGFLPRRVYVSSPSGSSGYDVSEVASFPSLVGLVYLPKEVIKLANGKQVGTWSLSDVIVNAQLPNSAFKPAFPRSVPIFRAEEPGEMKKALELIAEAKRMSTPQPLPFPYETFSKTIQDSRLASTPSQPVSETDASTVDATPVRFSVIQLIACLAGCACLLGAVLARQYGS